MLKIGLALALFAIYAHAEYDHMKYTKEALLSYEAVRDKTSYFGRKLQSMTFGDHMDKVLLIAPFVEGKFRYEKDNFIFKYNNNKEKGSIEYVYKF